MSPSPGSMHECYSVPNEHSSFNTHSHSSFTNPPLLPYPQQIDFVLSDDNRVQFGKANRKLVDSIISRPVSSLLPDKAVSWKLRGSLWNALAEADVEEMQAAVDVVYDQVGGRRLGDSLDVHKVMEQVPAAGRALDRFMERFEASRGA